MQHGSEQEPEGRMTPRPRLLILGASTRAAAWSAWRAGYQPVCVDLFLDEDLRAVAEVLPLESYPDGFYPAVKHLPPTPWIYTGGLENFPDIVEQISTIHPLCGNGSEILRLVRDPFWLESFYQRHSFASLRVSGHETPPPAGGNWLVKPLAGSGGRKIFRWTSEAVLSEDLRPDYYFQEYRSGIPGSALFLSVSQQTELIACFEQLIGHSSQPEIPPFTYRGSLYPLPLPEKGLLELERLGCTLAKSAGLQGLFGIDFVWSGETVWPVEVNPRYTASVELVEYALKRPLLAEHCLRIRKPGLTQMNPAPEVIAKQIIYAPVPLRIDRPLALPPEIDDPWQVPGCSDLPVPGVEIAAGEPVCTLLTTAPNRQSGLQRLAEAEQALLRNPGLVRRGISK